MACAWAAAFIGLYVSSLYSYLLFHALGELFSILVAWSIFIIVWNTREAIDNGYLVLMGVAYLFVGSLDLVHTLAFRGMNVFAGYDANLPTQLWVAARYMESGSFLIAPCFLKRKPRIEPLLAVYGLATSLVLVAVFSRAFPTCYVEGQGLTTFKKVSEYIISFALLASLVPLFLKRDAFERQVHRLLTASVVITICSELMFTLYVHVYAFWNMLGHILKVVSFVLIYKAIVYTGLRRPYAVLFRNLKKSEEDLREARDGLEEQVQARTRDLSRAYDDLQEEIAARKRLEGEILKAGHEEQRRIGQDLHDGLGQQLAGIAFKAALLKRSLAENAPQAVEAAEEIEELTREALSQTRQLARGLAPVVLDAGGLMMALEDLATGISNVFGVQCAFVCERPVYVDDDAAAMHLYRVAQESVNNAIRHGKAKRITVELELAGPKVLLRVQDDGQGFTEPRDGRPGMGLRVMEYRARVLDGTLTIERALSGGTVVTCSCPASAVGARTDNPGRKERSRA